MSKVYSSIIALNLFLAGLLYINGASIFLLNFEIAFGVALLIIYFSFKGYKSFIAKTLELNTPIEDRDVLSKIEDPFDLYDDEESEEAEKTTKKEHIKTLVKSGPGYFSKGRLLSYATLVVSFIALQRNHLLDISGFLIGLTLGLICALYVGFILGKKDHL